MTRKISLITAVAGAALVLSVPAAWGEPGPPPGYGAGGTSEGGAGTVVVSPDAFERAVANHQESSTAITSPDAFDRAVAAKLALDNPITSPDAVDRMVAAKQSEAQWLKALEARSEGLNRMYGLGEFATGRVYIDDRSEWLDPNSLPVNVSATSSDREIEWPQIGAGLGIGIVLAIGLVLALRLGRGRPLAHG